jgi:hypothetical protein
MGSTVKFVPSGCSKASAHQVFVLGDSHAGAYERNAYRLASDTGARVTILIAESCEPPLSIIPYDTLACREFVGASLEDIASKAGAGDVLFLPGLYVRRYRNFSESEIVETASLVTTAAATDLDDAKRRFEVLKPLIDRGMRIVIEAPKPLIKSAMFRCADKYTQWNPYATPRFRPGRTSKRVGLKRSRSRPTYLPRPPPASRFGIHCRYSAPDRSARV